MNYTAIIGGTVAYIASFIGLDLFGATNWTGTEAALALLPFAALLAFVLIACFAFGRVKT